MLLFIARGLSQEYGGRQIFTNVDLEIEVGEKAAVVGANGIGKTTLLQILAGLEPATKGNVKWYQTVKKGLFFPSLHPWDGQTVTQLLERSLGKDQANDGLVLAKRFGLTHLMHRTFERLSGGEKTRLGLACAIAQDPELLFLDEPTNHLDLEHLQWLEGFIRDYSGTILMVSHDRTFLDHSVSRILELEPKGLTSYPGNYSAYREAKRRQYEADLKTFYDQEKQALKLQRAIDEQMHWSEKGYARSKGKARASGNLMGGKEYYRKKAEKLDRRAKSNIKRLERFKEERVARPEEAATIQLAFHSDAKRGNGLLLGDGITKSYGGSPLLNDLRISLKPGQKVALIGSNGTGKTTLLRMILGQEPMDRGELWTSPALRIGRLEQELTNLSGERTVFEETLQSCSDYRKVRDMLASLLLRGEEVEKPCSVLSMGERVRVALAKMLLSSYNLLLLDEPGNYLDLPSREHLEAALREFQGAVILVSHDRTMIERVCDTVWAIEDKGLLTFPGRLSEYLASRQNKEVETDGEENKMRLELRLIELGSLLAQTDRQRQQEAYEHLETEYLTVAAKIRKMANQKQNTKRSAP